LFFLRSRRPPSPTLFPYTTLFRSREQLSAGRDVRGIKRGYQFDKVEMVKFVHPDTSREEHARLIQEAGDVLEALGLPYRILQMRSEEHTSELQSRENLVCRLLLEK